MLNGNEYFNIIPYEFEDEIWLTRKTLCLPKDH